jgi:hypothetical protein
VIVSPGAAELVTCETCGDHLMCAPGHPAHLVHCGDGSHTVHLGHPEIAEQPVG